MSVSTKTGKKIILTDAPYEVNLLKPPRRCCHRMVDSVMPASQNGASLNGLFLNTVEHVVECSNAFPVIVGRAKQTFDVHSVAWRARPDKALAAELGIISDNLTNRQ